MSVHRAGDSLLASRRTERVVDGPVYFSMDWLVDWPVSRWAEAKSWPARPARPDRSHLDRSSVQSGNVVGDGLDFLVGQTVRHVTHHRIGIVVAAAVAKILKLGDRVLRVLPAE